MTSPAELEKIPAGVGRPDYDRSTLDVGIVHIGVGGFHRSHQAMYLDRLLSDGLARDWAICGVGLLPGDARMREVMRAQDCAYTLLLKHPDGHEQARVIGSIVEYLFAPDDPAAVVERMADPRVRIVSLTITEGGYNINQVTGEFDAQASSVLEDLARPEAPRTAFGLVVEALRVRRERGVPPFTVLSCDNVQGNGEVARRVFAGYAALRDPELGRFVREQVSFPNSMVDRITPQTTAEDRAELAERYGVDDGWPVVAEPFAQWVIEDDFPAGRPPWEQAGAQLVEDVMPYELMKLRLLNASHQAMSYFGYLMGHRYAHEAASDRLLTRLLRRYWDQEAIPTLRPVPGIDLAGYTDTLLERYRNPAIRDTLARLCAESSDRIPKFLLPVAFEQIAAGRRVPLSAAVVASWARYAEGVDEQGEPIDVVDGRRDQVMAAARPQEDPVAFLRDPQLFGDLVHDEAFVADYLCALDLLHTVGAEATLEALLR